MDIEIIVIYIRFYVLIIDVISYVLIAFVSVSLVVSSIMIGIITLVPILQLILEPMITPVYEFFGASPAMFAGTILPVDSGGYPLAMQLAGNDLAIGNFSGVILGSTFGCIFIGMIPISLGILDEAVQWMQTEKYVLPFLIVVQLWLSLGTGFLSFIAGLQTVDKSMYEAAALDGVKNRWQELWYVTLPAMKPQLRFGAVMQITSSFAIADVSLNLAGNPSVNYAGATVVTHLLDYGTVRLEMGYASAIATILFLLMVGSNQLVQKLLRRVGE